MRDNRRRLQDNRNRRRLRDNRRRLRDNRRRLRDNRRRLQDNRRRLNWPLLQQIKTRPAHEGTPSDGPGRPVLNALLLPIRGPERQHVAQAVEVGQGGLPHQVHVRVVDARLHALLVGARVPHVEELLGHAAGEVREAVRLQRTARGPGARATRDGQRGVGGGGAGIGGGPRTHPPNEPGAPFISSASLWEGGGTCLSGVPGVRHAGARATRDGQRGVGGGP